MALLLSLEHAHTPCDWLNFENVSNTTATATTACPDFINFTSVKNFHFNSLPFSTPTVDRRPPGLQMNWNDFRNEIMRRVEASVVAGNTAADECARCVL